MSQQARTLSLTKRLYLGLLLAAALVFTVFFVTTWWTESRSMEGLLQQNGRSLAIGLEQSISLGMQLGELDLIRDGALSVANIPDVHTVDLYDAHGQRLLLLGSPHAPLSTTALGAVHQVQSRSIQQGAFERIISPIASDRGELVGYSVLDLSRDRVNASMHAFLRFSLLGSALLLLLFAWWITRLMKRQLQQPLDELDRAVAAVTSGDLDVSVEAAIPDPLGRIARAFNRMTRTLAGKEQALQESEQRFRELFINLPVAIYMADLDGKLRQCNPAMAKLFGFDSSDAMLAEVAGMGALYQDAAERDALIAELIQAETIVGREVHLRSRSGEEIRGMLNARLVADEAGRLIGVEGMIQDMTEVRTLEDRLLQSQKMELVGQLAGGVAHDFNNLLSVILGNAEMLTTHVPQQSKAYHHVTRISQAGRRAAELTSNLLGFARKGDMRHESVMIVPLLEEVIGLVRETGDRRVEIALNASRDDLQVIGDPGQLHQVFMNLCVNALHAMPEGGDLTIDVTSDAQAVTIRVQDTGVGMSKQTQERIFEPFFTTREAGKGTGLGLSMVYGIIDKMGGTIAVDSELGRGTVFEIALPLQGAPEMAATAATAADADTPTQGGRLLLVDDEAMLREVGEEILREHGYDVMTAASGEEALAIISSDMIDIDLVLLDLNMPGLGGVETLREIRRNGEDVKVIILSGYSETTLNMASAELRYDGFVSKPYQFNALCAEVARVLAL